MGFRLLLASACLCVGLSGAPIPLAAQGCPEHEPCRGCGCGGGPGYRGPDAACVSFRNLAKVCGEPPETRCVFENAPGTGANRDCALAPRPRKERRPSRPEAGDGVPAAAEQARQPGV